MTFLFIHTYGKGVIETLFVAVDEFVFYVCTDLWLVVSELEWFVHCLFVLGRAVFSVFVQCYSLLEVDAFDDLDRSKSI